LFQVPRGYLEPQAVVANEANGSNGCSIMNKKLVLLLSMICCLQFPAHGEDGKNSNAIEEAKAVPPPFTWLSPIWSEFVSFTTPGHFKAVTEQVKGNFYIREAVLRNETAERWTQMVTVTGAKGLASNPNTSPRKMAERIAGGFKRACPMTFSEKEIGPMTISGHDAYAALTSCGTAQNGGYAHSETTLIIAIKGNEDYYTLQWAERAAASDAPLDLSGSIWQDRLKTLNPVMIARL
jgi:hypothetical protein